MSFSLHWGRGVEQGECYQDESPHPERVRTWVHHVLSERVSRTNRLHFRHSQIDSNASLCRLFLLRRRKSPQQTRHLRQNIRLRLRSPLYSTLYTRDTPKIRLRSHCRLLVRHPVVLDHRRRRRLRLLRLRPNSLRTSHLSRQARAHHCRNSAQSRIVHPWLHHQRPM